MAVDIYTKIEDCLDINKEDLREYLGVEVVTLLDLYKFILLQPQALISISESKIIDNTSDEKVVIESFLNHKKADIEYADIALISSIYMCDSATLAVKLDRDYLNTLKLALRTSISKLSDTLMDLIIMRYYHYVGVDKISKSINIKRGNIVNLGIKAESIMYHYAPNIDILCRKFKDENIIESKLALKKFNDRLNEIKERYK